MSMFKLYQLCFWIPTKQIDRTGLTNKENIVNAILGMKIQVRKKTYFKYNYSEAVENLINKQVQAEQQAAQDYLGMAASFLHPKVSRPGAGGFFMKMYEEELGHMQDFLQYQILRGGVPKVCGIKEAKVNLSLTLTEAFTRGLEMEKMVTQVCGIKEANVNLSLTLIDAFSRGLEMEKMVTQLLENIVKAAEKACDYQCADFVTSVFLAEQMKSINEMSQHVTKLSRLCDEHAIYHYDLELARTHPFEYKLKV